MEVVWSGEGGFKHSIILHQITIFWLLVLVWEPNPNKLRN